MLYSCNRGMRTSFLLRFGVAAIALASIAHTAHADSVDTRASTASTSAVAAPKSAWPPTLQTGEAKVSGKHYFVEFRGRAAASYGHMYVLYGEVNDRDQIVRSRIAGLHPAGDAEDCFNCSLFNWTVGHVLFVPSETGPSDGDLEEKYVTSRYRVMLDKAQYDRVSAYIEKLQAENPLWNALWRNCVSFGKDIADYMGLRTPLFTWMEPKDFVDEMRKLNGGHPQQPLADANAPPAGGRSVSRKAVPARKNSAVHPVPKPRPARTASALPKPQR